MRSRLLGTLLFILLVAGAARPSFFRLLLPPHRPPHADGPANGIDRRPLRERDDPMPADLQSFLNAARRATFKGEKVGVVFAPPYDGFSYAYWRASYVLAGRTVLRPPSVRPIDDADVFVCWPATCDERGRQRVFDGFGGVLLRKTE